jgi:hypothetical protein
MVSLIHSTQRLKQAIDGTSGTMHLFSMEIMGDYWEEKEMCDVDRFSRHILRKQG